MMLSGLTWRNEKLKGSVVIFALSGGVEPTLLLELRLRDFRELKSHAVKSHFLISAWTHFVKLDLSSKIRAVEPQSLM